MFLLLFAVSLQTFDLLLYLIKMTDFHCNPIRLSSLPTRLTSHLPVCPWDLGVPAVYYQQSFSFFVFFISQDPHRPKEKFSWEDFCRRTRSHGDELRLIFHYIKKKRRDFFFFFFFFFLASVLILLNLIY